MSRKAKPTQTRPRLVTRSAAIWTAAAVAVLAAVVSGGLVVGMEGLDRASLRAWLSDFARSPGLAGVCAVFAAGLALTGILRQVAATQRGLDQQRQVAEDQRQAAVDREWWERFEWVAGRAIPASKDDTPLPYDAVLNTLAALTRAARDGVQQAAIGAVTEVASEARENQHVGAEEAGDRAAADDRIRQALKNYARAAATTPARSAAVDGELYEQAVVDALGRIAGPLNVDDRAPFRSSPDHPVRRADAWVEYMGKRILVECKYYKAPQPLDRDNAAWIKEMTTRPEVDAALVVASVDVEVKAPMTLNVVWNSPTDDNALRCALDALVMGLDPCS